MGSIAYMGNERQGGRMGAARQGLREKEKKT